MKDIFLYILTAQTVYYTLYAIICVLTFFCCNKTINKIYKESSLPVQAFGIPAFVLYTIVFSFIGFLPEHTSNDDSTGGIMALFVMGIIFSTGLSLFSMISLIFFGIAPQMKSWHINIKNKRGFY